MTRTGRAIDRQSFSADRPRAHLRESSGPGLPALAALLLSLAGAAAVAAQRPVAEVEAVPFAPRSYVSYRTPSAITVDGRLDEAAWAAAPWTDAFVDIEGDRRPRPALRTRARMLWDDEAFYIAADLEEPDVWGTLRERDAVIFHDNDFEVFIDPDGDSHAYYELEVNALGTPWDLLLIKPYRDGGPAVNGWDIAGLRVGVDVRGTINRPGDRDDGWGVELALPWKALKEAAPGQRAPHPGEQWRVNFSRVQWDTEVVEGGYRKKLKPGTSQPLPEHNWVWTPQSAVDMHMPERWGYVQFSDRPAGAGTEPLVDDPNEPVKWALRRIYYRQRIYHAAHGAYARTLDALDAGGVTVDGRPFRPILQSAGTQYEVTAAAAGGAVAHLNQEGRVWLTR